MGVKHYYLLIHTTGLNHFPGIHLKNANLGHFGGYRSQVVFDGTGKGMIRTEFFE